MVGIGVLFASGLANSSLAAPLAGRHLAGIKIGPWFTNAGDENFSEQGYSVDVQSTGFHFELFYHRYLTGALYGDISFGGVSRGNISINGRSQSGNQVRAVGDAAIYPIGAGLKLSPLAKNPTSVQPFVQAGGSLIIGTQREERLTGTTVGTFYTFDIESRLALGYYAGLGVDVDVGGQVGLNGTVKYQHAKFGDPLFGASDYSGIMVLVGVAYLHR